MKIENEVDQNDIENITNNTYITKTNANRKIIKTAKPSGFAGSSLHIVRLYSDGSVYLATYSDEVLDDSNIVENELIATNAEDIDEITYEEYEENNALEPGIVIIKGKNLNIINDGYGWISFEK